MLYDVSMKQIPPVCTLTKNESGDNLKYLRSILTSDGKCDCEIKLRIVVRSKKALHKKRFILTCANITISARHNFLLSAVVRLTMQNAWRGENVVSERNVEKMVRHNDE